MASIKTTSDMGNVKSLRDIIRYITVFAKDLIENINGNLEFDSNIKSSTIEVTFASANVEQGIRHGLKRIPTGYIVKRASVACSIYDGGTKNTSDAIFLKSSAAGTVTLIVI